MKNLRIAIGQINTIVGDLSGNRDKILFCVKEALKKDADLIIFPELAITGYPPEDLLLKPHFVKENIKYLKMIASKISTIIAIIGFADERKGKVYNSAAVIADKKISYIYHKMHLPNYGVFDEKRYFEPGIGNAVISIDDFSFVINICEDIWRDEGLLEKKVFSKAQFLLNMSASPYHFGKIEERRHVIGDKAKFLRIPIVYCNLVGGQDELVFDGRSALFNKDGRLIIEAKAFQEDLMILDLPVQKEKKYKTPNTDVIDINYKVKSKRSGLSRVPPKPLTKCEEIYSALVLGVRDYVRKNGFNKVAFGLSGGIDSALVACIAVDSLGKENVLSLSMPSRYSSQGAQDDAEKIAKNLGMRVSKIPIDSILDSYLDTLAVHFKGTQPGVTEENIQARIRGNILMAFSNRFGYLVLNTGNKSETSAGYCTLYGDMAGGFSVIKDVSKNLVYELARYRNKRDKKEVIPETVFKRPPSAELRPNQKDQDTLPPYEILDRIIYLYIEKKKGLREIVKEMGQKDVVAKVLNMIDANEYKRRQAPPGIKITPIAFAKDRRMPITNKFRG